MNSWSKSDYDAPGSRGDVATKLWGSNWKTPTKQQLDTLQNSSYGKTTWTWCDGSTTQYVVGCVLTGYKVSGVGAYADKSIFLPAAGMYQETILAIRSVGLKGYYWTQSARDSPAGYYYPGYANLIFNSSSHKIDGQYGDYGYSVRAILVEEGATALEDIHIPTTGVQKIFRDGQVLILRDGVIYDTTGRMVEK